MLEYWVVEKKGRFGNSRLPFGERPIWFSTLSWSCRNVLGSNTPQLHHSNLRGTAVVIRHSSLGIRHWALGTFFGLGA